MKTLDRRLSLLEQKIRPPVVPAIRVLYDDDLADCEEHLHCAVDLETGSHHKVIRLRFAEAP